MTAHITITPVTIVMQYAIGEANRHHRACVRMQDMRGRVETWEASRIRHFVWALLRAIDPEKYSYPVLARLFRMRDHSVVHYGVRRAHAKHGEGHFLKLARFAPRNHSRQAERITG